MEQILLLGAGGPVLIAENRQFRLLSGEGAGRVIEHGYTDLKFLTASPTGDHFAFWAHDDEKFHVVTPVGTEVWSRRINTDRARPHRICFSQSGDAVACFDDYDGLHRLHFYQLRKHYSEEFGSFASPIGVNAELSHFVEIPREVEETLPLTLNVLDRHRRVHYPITLPFSDWTNIAIGSGGHDWVAVRNSAVVWCRTDKNAAMTVPASVQLPEEIERLEYEPVWAELGEKLVLVRAADRAVLLMQCRGVIWHDTGVSSIHVHGGKAVAIYTSGTIGIISDLKKAPVMIRQRHPWRIVAAGVFGDSFHVAAMTENSTALRFMTLDEFED